MPTNRRSPTLVFRPPMLATLSEPAAFGPTWWFERKLDGIRLVCCRDHEEVRLWTRNGLSRNESWPEVVDALLAQPDTRFVLDGEVVAFHEGRDSFAALQRRRHLSPNAAADSVYLYVFDLLSLDGEDLQPQTLLRRRAALEGFLHVADPIRLTTPAVGDPVDLLAAACRDGWEGLIAKDSSTPYEPGRSRAWRKLKCVADSEFVIGGWTDPAGARTDLGALLVGQYDGDGLCYAGKVGTGFDAATLAELRRLLTPLARPSSPFVDVDRSVRAAHWVQPVLVCQVGFTEWTSGGRLRHPRFLGLRDDKPARDVHRDSPTR